MKLKDFDYSLPEHLVAQFPPKTRRDSRLLVLDRGAQSLSHRGFKDLTEFLRPGDLMVFNNTQVMPSRLYGVKATGGKVEVFVERVLSDDRALCLIKASKTLKVGACVFIAEEIVAEVVRRRGAFFEVEFKGHSIDTILQEHGQVPLPPYIKRRLHDFDSERYQTVYASQKGAVAAPTAGLHFDEDLMDALAPLGVGVDFVTLHVGSGTFQPVRVDNIDEHTMHHEWLDVPEALVAKIAHTRKTGGRVIAVGTTTVRALETMALMGAGGGYCGQSNLFIKPGFDFKVVDALVTNFHLPKSTLMMMVSAFAGRKFILNAYKEAIENEYFLFSYGDAMLIL